jgi:TetR/AcrR family transcriptional repressor of nem operon
MRYPRGHKEISRQHIVDVASRRFREDGVAATGLAGIMTDAGLTIGAFYTHFASKESLVRETILDALERRTERLRSVCDGENSLELGIRDYLNARHRDDAGKGCLTAALAAEIARHPISTRNAFTEKIVEVVDLLAVHIPAASPDLKRQKAIALYAMMIGAMQLARAVNDKHLADEILESGVAAALRFIGID